MSHSVVYISKGNKIKKTGNKLSVSALVDAVLSRTRTSKVWEYFTPNTAKTEALACYFAYFVYTELLVSKPQNWLGFNKAKDGATWSQQAN